MSIPYIHEYTIIKSIEGNHMVTFFPNNPITHISNGTIENITTENNANFVTISYTERQNNREVPRTVRLVVGRNTTVLDENGNFVPARTLATGMIVNAVVSSAMTRSIPPQTAAYLVRIVSRAMTDNIVTGRILEVDRENRSFTAAGDRNLSSIIRFNVPENAAIFGRGGREMNFSRLMPGMRVRVRHAPFMTASIPPQTTAFEIRVL